MEKIKIIKAVGKDFLAESTKGDTFLLAYECKDNEGRLFLKGGKRRACLKVKDILFWLHFLYSNNALEIEVEREILA